MAKKMRSELRVLMGPFALGLVLSIPSHAQQKPATRDIKVVSSAGARALADACTAWAEQNKQTVAMAIIAETAMIPETHLSSIPGWVKTNASGSLTLSFVKETIPVSTSAKAM